MKPARLSFVEAAAVPLCGLTAYRSLVELAEVQAGQSVLIQAAAGGVGAVGTLADFRDSVRRSIPEGVDVALDAVGDEVQVRSAEVARKGGVLVSIRPYADEAALQALGIRTKYLFVAPNGAHPESLTRWIDEGRLLPQVADVLHLAEAARAHELSESRLAREGHSAGGLGPHRRDSGAGRAAVKCRPRRGG